MQTFNGVNKQNCDDLDLSVARRFKKLEKRERKRMKISGASVKQLQKIIAK
jgi:hypothetical protein